ncbi:MAG TPA: M36 family metallopeptidase [Polyangiaceae bacterium]|nr:M36 family metallopeptidase [Polyangiaceae bacterium]
MRSPNRPLTVRALLVASLPLAGSLLSCSSQPQDPAPAPAPAAAKTSSVDSKVELLAPSQAIVASVDAVRNVPRFMWGVRDEVSPTVLANAAPEVAARAHLARHAATYGLSTQVVGDALIHDVHPLQGGASIVSFRQSVGGIEVYGVRQAVAMTADRQLVAMSGSLHPGKLGSNKFVLSEGQALALALSDRIGSGFDESSFEAVGTRNGYAEYAFAAASHAAGAHFVDNATVKKAYMPNGGTLEAAYFVEFLARTEESSDNDGWRYIVSAKDGSVLERMPITQSDAFNYKVFADAKGQPADGPQTDYSPHPTNAPLSKPNPLYAAPIMISTEGFNKNPAGAVDPWLPATATETNGNNVNAYSDNNTTSEDGFTPLSGDVHATVTSDKTFDRVYDPTKDPQWVDPNSPTVFNDPQRMAAVTQLFYVTNWLHDYWYDSGFNEAAGNAQQSNFGRGGLELDPLKVEAQDDAPWGTRNNANMSTRAEGTSPRMQMYLWSGIETSRTLTSSPSLTFTGPIGIGTWGPQNFELTQQTALAFAGPPTVSDAGTDGGDAATDVRVDAVDVRTDSGGDSGSGDGSDGASGATIYACGNVTSAVAGKIAIVEEGGGCTTAVKVVRVQTAGAVGMVVVSAGSTLVSMAGRPNPKSTIPAFAINAADGALIKNALAADGSTLSLTMKRVIGTENDGTIDNTISAHEWGHYFHLRLVQCGNTQCGAMSEGWGDFVALHLLAHEGENLDGAYPVAAYAGQGIEVDPWYFGIRRAPYSVDFKKNALTFRHIQAGEPLPTTTPMSPSTNPNNEVHAAGEVWTTMMHEVHVAMLKESQGVAPRMTWTEAHRRVANYVVAGMKMTPPAPTYTDQRDAILAAAAAVDKQDLLVMAKAFARRGAGTGAKSPPQNSSDLVGVVESYAVKGDIHYLSTSLDDSVKSCDRDGYLDAEEEGYLTIKLVNNGVSDLSKTTVTVQTSVPGVTLENNGVVTLPTLEPFKEATVRLKVTLDATFMSLVLLPVTITVNDPDAFTSNTPVDFPVWVNRDNVPASSATDDVESDTPVWEKVHIPLPLGDGGVAPPDSGAPPPAVSSWERERTTGPGANNQWHGQDIAVRGDEALISPPLIVAATGNLVMTFRHAYSFEANTTAATPQYFDGGVIEYSEDNGTTWIDIATIKDPGYNATLTTAAGTIDNPLQGRRAFAAISAGFPTMTAASVDLGAGLAGKTIKVRFRLGTDTGTGAPGWLVDNIGFQGITNKPFPGQQADTAACAGIPIANAGPDQPVPVNAMVTLDGRASSDPLAGPNPLAFAWDQLAGPAVTLATPTTAQPTFTAPSTPSTLTFRLQVNDGPHGAADTVNIIVAGGGGAPDGGTDGGMDGGGGSGGGGAGGTDGGRDGAAGAADVRDATTDGVADVRSDATDARADATDARADVRSDGAAGAGGSGGGEDDGCGCRIAQPKERSSNTGAWASLLGAIALLAGRRRQRR